jgi:hypothetical protein
MAILSKTGITTGNTVEAWHVTQSIDAFNGTAAYDISLSGSFNMTGSITGQPGVINNLTASYAMNATNFANTNLTFTGDRTHNTNNNYLWITSNTSSLYTGQYLYFAAPISLMGIGVTQSIFGIDNTFISVLSNTANIRTLSFTVSGSTLINLKRDSTNTSSIELNPNNVSNLNTNIYQDVSIIDGTLKISTTQSMAPTYTGADGEIVPATIGGQHYLYMWMGGAWRSSSFS